MNDYTNSWVVAFLEKDGKIEYYDLECFPPTTKERASAKAKRLNEIARNAQGTDKIASTAIPVVYHEENEVC